MPPSFVFSTTKPSLSPRHSPDQTTFLLHRRVTHIHWPDFPSSPSFSILRLGLAYFFVRSLPSESLIWRRHWTQPGHHRTTCLLCACACTGLIAPSASRVTVEVGVNREEGEKKKTLLGLLPSLDSVWSAYHSSEPPTAPICATAASYSGQILPQLPTPPETPAPISSPSSTATISNAPTSSSADGELSVHGL